jgi:hypothetical protein
MDASTCGDNAGGRLLSAPQGNVANPASDAIQIIFQYVFMFLFFPCSFVFD